MTKFKNIRRPARASKVDVPVLPLKQAKTETDLSPSSVAEYESHIQHHRSRIKVTSGHYPV